MLAPPVRSEPTWRYPVHHWYNNEHRDGGLGLHTASETFAAPDPGSPTCE